MFSLSVAKESLGNIADIMYINNFIALVVAGKIEKLPFPNGSLYLRM